MSVDQIQAAPVGGVINAATAVAQVFPLKTNATLPAILPVPGSGRLEGRKFRVRASGTFTGSAAGVTLVPFLATGSSVTYANDTVLAAPGTATTVGAVSGSWYLEAQCLFDSASGKLSGYYNGEVNGTPIAATAFNTTLTGLNGQTEPVMNLVAGLVFSTASTANIGTLTEFVLEG